jgi:hypothetical protein
VITPSIFSDLKRKYGAFFVDPNSSFFGYGVDAIHRLVSTVEVLESAIRHCAGEAVYILPAPAVPIGISEIYRKFPEHFSSAPVDWSSKEMKRGIDPSLERDMTAPGIWYLLRVPREPCTESEVAQVDLSHPEYEMVPGLATLLWASVSFASCGKGRILVPDDGCMLRTSTYSADGGPMIILGSKGRLVVSDCLGPECVGTAFLQCVALPSA